ncbi:MAG: GIY-YIG nuclease family protein [Clostridiales Family XIII bacterium]|nr:GIY-YIG nuclease family protein [Clostridia bacterium]MDY3011457.1 GIY-YIG nuclease family protein [Clostridiales Family XIII bacterium]
MRFPRTIYALQHNRTGRMYIGSTQNITNRYKSHIYALRGNKHTNEEMQKDFDEHGEDFSLFILGEITSYEERFKEYELMREYGTFDMQIGYNYKDHCGRSVAYKKTIPIKEGLPKPNKKGGKRIESSNNPTKPTNND